MSLSVSEVDFGEQNVIYIAAPAEKEKAYGVEWTVPATESLLKYLRRYMKLFILGKLKTKRQMYENVSVAMEEKQGMFYSSSQCENKWKSLKRTYITKYEKGSHWNRRFSFASKTPYESQVEELLKIERPSFKKEIEFTEVNLNVPPGYTKIEPESGSDEEADQVHVYTDEDAELVQKVLREPYSADHDLKDNQNIKFIPTQSDEEHNYSYSNNLENQDSISLVDEVIEIKKIIKKNLNANTEVLRNHSATHEQILTYLDTLEKREEEKLEIKRRKLDKQEEIVYQLKIQNSLIAKLIQKMGNT